MVIDKKEAREVIETLASRVERPIIMRMGESAGWLYTMLTGHEMQRGEDAQACVGQVSFEWERGGPHGQGD